MKKVIKGIRFNEVTEKWETWLDGSTKIIGAFDSRFKALRAKQIVEQELRKNSQFKQMTLFIMKGSN